MNWREPASFGSSLAAHAIVILLLTLAVSTVPSDSARRTVVELQVVDRKATAPAVSPQAGSGVETGSAPVASASEKPRKNSSGKRPPGKVSKHEPVMKPAPVAVTTKPDEVKLANPATDETAKNVTSSLSAGNGPDSSGPQGAESGDDEMADTAGDGKGSVGGNGAGGPGAGAGAGDRYTKKSGDDQEKFKREYAMMLRRMLERGGAYPRTARRLGIEGLVRMLVSIDKNGNVAGTAIQTSSGYPELDRAALASVERIGSLPPPPDESPLEILVPIRFSMRRM